MKILTGIVSILVISFILYIFYITNNNREALETYNSVDDCIVKKTKNLNSDTAVYAAVRLCQKIFADRANLAHYKTILSIEKTGYTYERIINLNIYRSQNSSYYGQRDLLGVAIDLYKRSNSSGEGLTFDQFIKSNGMIGQLADEARARGITER